MVGVDDRQLTGVNPNVPNVARIYDFFLGGKDNFAADREAAEKIVATAPETPRRTRENRAFLGRAVRLLARAGIRQFLDVGTGLPTQENVHQVAQKFLPDARVAYVDNDPVVLAHARAILGSDPGTIAIEGDMRDPAKIIESAAKDGFLDLRKPTAILMVAVLHFIPDTAEAARIVAAFRASMARGSFLVITHGTAGDMDEGELSPAVQLYRGSSAGSITMRTHAEIESFFGDLELLSPGLVPTVYWRPKGRTPATVAGPHFLGGVARRP